MGGATSGLVGALSGGLLGAAPKVPKAPAEAKPQPQSEVDKSRLDKTRRGKKAKRRGATSLLSDSSSRLKTLLGE